MTCLTKKFLNTIFLTILVFCFVFGFFVTNAKVLADTNQSSKAYYIGEDRETKGLWYTGKKGTKEYAINRVYGKSGAILVYHGQVADGNNVLGKEDPKKPYADNHDTFSGGKTAHYVEYPTWVNDVDFSGSVGMWNNEQNTVDEAIANTNSSGNIYGDGRLKPLLYIDFDDEGNPEKKVGTPCAFISDKVQYTFSITDESWHVITAYIGSSYQYETSTYAESNLVVYDSQNNLLFSERVKNVNVGVYVSFAVKGTVKMELNTAGYYHAAISGIFFDELIEDNTLGVSNFSLQLNGAKTVELSWENNSSDSLTSVYRRKLGETNFDYLATVSKGVESYVDENTSVATNYEYTLISGKERLYSDDRSWDYYGYAMTGYPMWEHGIGVNDFNILNYDYFISCATAPYERTYIEFVEQHIGCEIGETIFTEVVVYKNTVYDSLGNLLDKGLPYANREVCFTLNGERVFSELNGEKFPNMETDIYVCITDENGKALLRYEPLYVGEYQLEASIKELADKNDVMKGYDSCSTSTGLVVFAQEEKNTPYLLNVTDAIKPGDAFTITGNFIGLGNQTKVAYAPYNGDNNRAFDENISGLKYLDEENIVNEDTTFNTGVTLIFPEDENAGVFDFWVKNAYGWSNVITLNKPRALYINTDGAYAGLPIEVVGRNLLGSEYGRNASFDYETMVKLVRIANLYGNADSTVGIEYEIDIEHGIKYQKEETFIGEEIKKSNPFRLEFVLPNTVISGIYNVYVSTNGGIGYSLLESNQTLKVFEKKQSNYNANYFGNDTHIGNDPLDLKLYWAQDFNYNNVVVVPNEYFSQVDDYTAWGGDAKLSATNTYLQQQIDYLSQTGGGVLYLPNGYYYISSLSLKSGVIVVGESTENTVIKITYPKNATQLSTSPLFSNSSEISYSGVARLSITLFDNQESLLPDGIFWVDCNYFFVSEIFGNFPRRPTNIKVGGTTSNQRGLGYYQNAHNLIQNSKWISNNTLAYCSESSTYNIIRNVDMDVWSPMSHMGTKYAFVENTKYVGNGQDGHGWSGRDCCYCAYNYVSGIGSTYNAINKGEIFFFEPPNSVHAIGNILSATERTFTIYRKNGDLISSETEFGYNQCAIQITDGKGVGQIRYFDKTAIASLDGKNYGNTYELCSWEDGWDIIPDHSSVFSIFEPMTGQTIYNNVADNCAKSLMLFSQCSDSVIYGNRLTNTEGIQVYNDSSSDCLATNMYVRVENNVIRGVSTGTGRGGLEVIAGKNAGYFGVSDIGVLIRGNKLYDLRNYHGYFGSSEFSEYRGINLYTKENTTTDPVGSIRFVVIENNYVENCDYGVRSDAGVFGVYLKDNEFKNVGVNGVDIPTNYNPATGMASEDVTIYESVAVNGVNLVKFIVNGKEDTSLSKKYYYKQSLPTLSGAFLGWAKTEKINNVSQIVLYNDGGISTYYAIFGYNVSMRYNYERSDGKVEYRSLTILEGDTISLGRPVRVGYSFEGWFYDKACTKPYDASAKIDSDVILYAKWVSNDGEDIPITQTPEKSNVGLIVGISCGAVVIIGGICVCLYLNKKRKTK